MKMKKRREVGKWVFMGACFADWMAERGRRKECSGKTSTLPLWEFTCLFWILAFPQLFFQKTKLKN